MKNLKHKVLVLDDDHELAGLISNSLKDEFEVVEMTDIADVFLYLGNHHIQAAVLDFHLDVSNGFNVFDKLQNIYPDLPVVFLSADHRVGDLVREIQSQKCAFIPKPLLGDELNQKLNNLIETENPQPVA